jgi:DNA topoisomerase-1
VDVRSDDVNAFIKDVAGQEFSPKDFRTWNAIVLAAKELADLDLAATSPAARKRAVKAAVKQVAEHLGNTPAVCRSAYIDPRAIELFHRGQTITLASPRAGPRRVEQAVLSLPASDFQKPRAGEPLEAVD